MKTISAMDVRKGLGSILDEVRLKSETFILERAGKAIAMISPIRKEASHSDHQHLKLAVIQELKGIHSTSTRGKNPELWIKSERDSWAD